MPTQPLRHFHDTVRTILSIYQFQESEYEITRNQNTLRIRYLNILRKALV